MRGLAAVGILVVTVSACSGLGAAPSATRPAAPRATPARATPTPRPTATPSPRPTVARRIEPTGRLVYDARALLADEVTASVTLVNRGDGRQRPTMWAIADAGLLFVGCRPQCRLDVEYDGTSIVSWPALDPHERKRYTVVFQAQALGAQLWTIRLDENGDGVLDGETYWDLTTRVLLR